MTVNKFFLFSTNHLNVILISSKRADDRLFNSIPTNSCINKITLID